MPVILVYKISQMDLFISSLTKVRQSVMTDTEWFILSRTGKMYVIANIAVQSLYDVDQGSSLKIIMKNRALLQQLNQVSTSDDPAVPMRCLSTSLLHPYDHLRSDALFNNSK